MVGLHRIEGLDRDPGLCRKAQRQGKGDAALSLSDKQQVRLRYANAPRQLRPADLAGLVKPLLEGMNSLHLATLPQAKHACNRKLC